MTPLPAPALTLDGIDIFVEGSGTHTVVMLHGWPDTCRLWDATVQSLHHQYRCVRFTLPGFDSTAAPRPTSLEAMTAFIAKVIAQTSPGAPVTLLMHDWGCMYGYAVAASHPALVARIAAADIGDYNTGTYVRSLPARAKLGIVVYQLWLAVAWKIGKLHAAGGNWMTRFMARQLRCPVPPAALHWQVNYPYAMQWFGLLGGFKGAAKVRVTHPTLYLYGLRKPFMFQSPQWLATLQATPGCAVHAMRTGHWIMLDKPAEFSAHVLAWLDSTVVATTVQPDTKNLLQK